MTSNEKKYNNVIFNSKEGYKKLSRRVTLCSRKDWPSTDTVISPATSENILHSNVPEALKYNDSYLIHVKASTRISRLVHYASNF
jgi:hypothetical protein